MRRAREPKTVYNNDGTSIDVMVGIRARRLDLGICVD